jgi:hypothetical protein
MFEQEGTEEREVGFGESASFRERHSPGLNAQACVGSVAASSSGFHSWQEDDWQD